MRNRFFKIASLLMALILVASAFAGCRKKNDAKPTEDLGEALENTIRARFDTDGLKEITGQETGSIKLTMGESPLTDELGIGAVSVETYVGKAGFAASGSASADGIPFAIDVWAKDDELAVKFPLFFGEDTYGTKLSELQTNFNGSIFANPEGKYYIDIPEWLKSFDFGAAAKSIAEYQNKILEYSDFARELVEKNITTEKTSEKDGKIVTSSIGKDGIKNVISGILTKAKNDKEFNDMLTGLMSLIDLASEPTGYVQTEEMTEEYEDSDGTEYAAVGQSSDGNVLKVFYMLLSSNEALDEIFAALDELGDFGITVSGKINGKYCLDYLDMSVHFTNPDDASDKITIGIKADFTEENITVLSLSASGNSLPDELKTLNGISVVYEVKEDTSAVYKSNITVKMSGISASLLDIDYDKKSGDYVLSSNLGALTGESGNIAVKGNYKINGKTLTLTVTNIEIPGSEAIDPAISVTVTGGAEVPAMPAYKDILKVTEEEFDVIAARIEALD